MYLSGGQNIQKSMNGLLKIRASEIDAEIANIGIINNLGEINGKIGENLIIDVDTGKVIEFKDDVTMDASLNVSTINNLSLINGKIGQDLIVNVDAGRVIQFKDNVVMDTSLNVKTINGLSSINGPVGQDLIIDVDTNRVIKFKDNVVMDSSLNVKTINGLSLINGPATGDLIIDAGNPSQIVEFKNDVNIKSSLTVDFYLDVSDNAYFNSDIGVSKNAQIDGSLNVLSNLDVSGNVIVGKNGNSSLDVTGVMTLRETTDPTNISMSILYIPAGAGFRFINNQPNGYIYFTTKDGAGNLKNFQFNSSQVYSNLIFYCDNWSIISYNNPFILGDGNGSVFLGCSQMFIPNNAVTSGHVTYVKGLQNNDTYYSNWVHVNTSNVDVPTFRINYANIWSKVQHTMESNLILSSSGVTFNDATIQTTAFTSAKNTKLVAIGGITTSTLNATNQLTTNTIYNCGSVSLAAGTYIIQVNCAVDIITGSTVINNMIGAWSTSATAFSQFLNTGRLDGGGFTYPAGCTWSLNSTDTIVVSTTTTYYMLVRVIFGTATRVRFVNPSSQFRATRIA